jgi:hypothetical protein
LVEFRIRLVADGRRCRGPSSSWLKFSCIYCYRSSFLPIAVHYAAICLIPPSTIGEDAFLAPVIPVHGQSADGAGRSARPRPRTRLCP